MCKLMFYWCWSSREEAGLQQQPLLEESTAMSYHDLQSLAIQKIQKGKRHLKETRILTLHHRTSNAYSLLRMHNILCKYFANRCKAKTRIKLIIINQHKNKILK